MTVEALAAVALLAGLVGVQLVADRRCRNDELLMRRGLGVVGLIATAPAAGAGC